MGLRLCALAVVVVAVCSACAGAARVSDPAGTTEHASRTALGGVAEPAHHAWRVPDRPAGAGAYLMARLDRPLPTRFGTVKARTPFGEPVWVPVLRRRGAHAVVLAPVGASTRHVRLDLRRLALRWTRVRVVVDLASARLTVLRGARRLGSFPVGQGTPATPTPTGRFLVTERLTFAAGSPYAPFAFGLSAHQTHLAPTWNGGDQIAIHPGAMGPVSNGCIHTGLAAIGLLRRTAPLGTLVTVRG